MKKLPTSSDWTFDDILEFTEQIDIIAKEELNLDTYTNQIEIITAEQMLDAYSSNGLPVNYRHWSFGKDFMYNMEQYRNGRKGLAYEIVINSDPTIAYLMEENTLPMQALVIAHACYGHNAFFKNNYLFRERTNATTIVDFMEFAQQYIRECEEKYGEDEVEDFIDHVHALRNFGFDHYKRPEPLSKEQDDRLRAERIKQDQAARDAMWDKLIPQNEAKVHDDRYKFPSEPTENILHFIEKFAPNMDEWQREIIMIMRKIQEYFVPQMQTQVANEGFATFTHRYIIQRLFEKGLVGHGFMQELLISHTNVIMQPTYDKQYYSGINPYALGYAMLEDIRRICTDPTDEDKQYMPHLIGKDWIEAIKEAAFNHRDESFIQQYLSPKVVRDFGMFASVNDQAEPYIEITAVQDNEGFEQVKAMLSAQKDVFNRLPKIEIVDVDVRGDRTLTLRYVGKDGTDLEETYMYNTMQHVQALWDFKVVLERHIMFDDRIECTIDRMDRDGDIFERRHEILNLDGSVKEVSGDSSGELSVSW